ncbi:MAG: CYTH domain-containing protein [Rhodomicrobium sp.]
MAYEIERKFLIGDESWQNAAGKSISIRQAYLARGVSSSLRVRVMDNVRATLTVKSAAATIKRLEFEYPVPLADAVALFGLREGAIIEKLRYKLPQNGLTWEVDVFQGENEGLVIAEIELPHEDMQFEKPGWLGREITLDPNYSNASLAKAPFRSWPVRAAG